MPESSASELESEIRRVVQLHESGATADALALAERLISEYAGVALLHNFCATLNKALGNIDAAVAQFEIARQLDPGNAEQHYNLGNCYRALGEHSAAIKAYGDALELKPGLSAASNNRGNSLKDLGRLKDALGCFGDAIRSDPGYAQAYYNRANTLQALKRFEAALSDYAAAVKLGFAPVDLKINVANCYFEMGRYDDALSCAKQVIKIAPENPGILNNMGNSLVALGKIDEAIISFERAIALKPDYAAAHRNLGAVKRYVPGDPAISAIRGLLNNENQISEDRVHLDFALAKALVDTGEYAEAFRHFEAANTLHRQLLNYDFSADEKLFQKIHTSFASPGLETVAPAEQAGLVPVFIVGMPHSGTTLVEQMLASHPDVHGAGELRLLSDCITGASSAIQHLSLQHFEHIRESYLEGISKLASGKRYVTDKLPLNSLWIGFIVHSLPEAKIIHIERDARAVCWSNFRHYFSSDGMGYSCNLHDVASFYVHHQRLMSMWKTRYPERIYSLDYQRLTEAPETEISELLAHIGLSWSEACLDFNKSSRAISTASSVQVRKKLYRGSSEEWRKFEDHLGPMLEILGTDTAL